MPCHFWKVNSLWLTLYLYSLDLRTAKVDITDLRPHCMGLTNTSFILYFNCVPKHSAGHLVIWASQWKWFLSLVFSAQNSISFAAGRHMIIELRGETMAKSSILSLSQY